MQTYHEILDDLIATHGEDRVQDALDRLVNEEGVAREQPRLCEMLATILSESEWELVVSDDAVEHGPTHGDPTRSDASRRAAAPPGAGVLREDPAPCDLLAQDSALPRPRCARPGIPRDLRACEARPRRHFSPQMDDAIGRTIRSDGANFR